MKKKNNNGFRYIAAFMSVLLAFIVMVNVFDTKTNADVQLVITTDPPRYYTIDGGEFVSPDYSELDDDILTIQGNYGCEIRYARIEGDEEEAYYYVYSLGGFTPDNNPKDGMRAEDYEKQRMNELAADNKANSTVNGEQSPFPGNYRADNIKGLYVNGGRGGMITLLGLNQNSNVFIETYNLCKGNPSYDSVVEMAGLLNGELIGGPFQMNMYEQTKEGNLLNIDPSESLVSGGAGVTEGGALGENQTGIRNNVNGLVSLMGAVKTVDSSSAANMIWLDNSSVASKTEGSLKNNIEITIGLSYKDTLDAAGEYEYIVVSVLPGGAMVFQKDMDNDPKTVSFAAAGTESANAIIKIKKSELQALNELQKNAVTFTLED